MDRINTKDENGNPTFSEENGKRLFRNGDPHGPEEITATRLDASWFNAVQEEICGMIESQGIELGGQHDGLLKAINKRLEPIEEKIQVLHDAIYERETHE